MDAATLADITDIIDDLTATHPGADPGDLAADALQQATSTDLLVTTQVLHCLNCGTDLADSVTIAPAPTMAEAVQTAAALAEGIRDAHQWECRPTH